MITESKEMSARRRRLGAFTEELRLAEGAIELGDDAGVLANDIEAVLGAYLTLMRCVQVDPEWPWDPEASFVEHGT